MDTREALHTLARRHCMERHAHWAQVYEGLCRKESEEPNWEYSDEANATFPRYLVWQAILDEVERIETRFTPTTGLLRAELAAAGFRAQTVMTTNPKLPAIAIKAMAEERDEFASFVSSVPENALNAVEPLLLRRVFGKDELQRLWDSLSTRWDIAKHEYWWPLRAGAAPPSVVAFHEDYLDDAKLSAVRKILIAHSVDRVWELREFGERGCEQSVEAFKPAYNGEEGYFTSSGFEWVVYASHESSITLAGDWLVAGFRDLFPACEKFSYEGPMSTPDQRGTWEF